MQCILFEKNITSFHVGDFDTNLSDHCPITVKMLSRSVHYEHELALRPKPINIKWSKSVEEQFTANLSCTNFKGIIDNISATKEKICSGFGHDERGIVSDINEIVTIFSTNLRNAALDSRAVSKNVKSSQHDTNVTPSPLVSGDNNSQLENIRLIKQSHIISSNRSIQPSEMHTKVSNSSSSTTSTKENNIYDKTSHTDNNNLGSSESGKYDILMLHDSICREIDIQRLHRNSQSQRKWFKQVAYTAVEAQKFSDDISYANTVVLHVGLNDLKVCSADDAFYEYEITVNKLLKKTDCLLLSCVTPVKYERLNEKVAEFNEKIKSRFSKVNNIRISFNSNFINDGRVCVNLYKDAVRLSPQGTSVLASNLKKCLFKVGHLVRQP